MLIGLLERLGLLAFDAASLLRRSRAVADRMNVVLPTEITREVTDVDRAIIGTARDLTTDDFLWTRPGGARDEVCMRLCLTRDQVKGVLAGRTRREDREPAPGPTEATVAPAEAPVPPAPAVEVATPAPAASAPRQRRTPRAPAPKPQTEVSVLDPNSWPPARDAISGAVDAPPDKPEYRLETADRELIPRLHAAAGDSWQAVQRNYCAHRRITRQQSAGALAAQTRSDRLATST